MDVGASPSPAASPSPQPSSSVQPSPSVQPPAGDGASPSTQQPAAGASSLQERAATILHERPEVGVGAAFGGGLILALILKRLAR